MPTPRVRLTPISQADQVGGSTWHVQEGRRGLLLDFGSDLKASGALLAGKIRRRDSRGIGDAIALGLLPRYEGIYRTDLLADPEIFDDADRLRVEDALITHAHADHAGELYALSPDIRVHATRLTAALLHAGSTCAQGLQSEATSFVERLPHETELGLLAKPRKSDAVARPIVTVDGPPSEAMLDFWAKTGTSAGLAKSDLRAAGMRFRAHEVDHSVVGACAYELLTAQGRVVHAGDLRQSGANAEATERFIAWMERHRPRALILEGTRVNRPADDGTTEAKCRSLVRRLVKDAGNRLVIASYSPNHVERLSAFLSAAECAGRRLLVPARTMLILESVAAADPRYDLAAHPSLGVYDPGMLSRPRWHQELRDRHEDRLVVPEQVRKDGSRYVLSHSFMRMPDWIDVRPQGALYVYSSSAAYDDRARGEHSALKLWTEMFGMEVEGIRFTGGRCEYDGRLAPSGHLSEDELRRLLQRARPELLIPVHTEHAEAFSAFAPKGTRVVLPENGRTITLS